MSFTSPPGIPPLPSNPPKRPGFWSMWSKRKRVAVIAVGAVVAVGACGVITAAQGGEERVEASTSEGLTNGADEAVRGCADSWNKDNANKGNVASIATAAQQSENATAYVNVGFSDLFPDRCMMTVANP
ncbi:hypothetical protein ABZ454_10900 [Streptomyces sp. NPDC005803]|uniref:hypothetical protein n=1 Tax=Streptomyces sp. NPDC005803 TaxID=3154297 RepID=UPI0033DE29EB